ncbi:hypothetical protein FHR32_005024 [Streptosporangium album]|uniref:Uncharacterized protein n=1 Tax=Streptosporangium album TaxID=47479 RepID=A0A7W7WAP3_9ACTN|nr:hypothetical protein [Streptosporangium album]
MIREPELPVVLVRRTGTFMEIVEEVLATMA